MRKALPFYRFPIILLWLKSPSPSATCSSASFINLHNYFFNNLIALRVLIHEGIFPAIPALPPMQEAYQPKRTGLPLLRHFAPGILVAAGLRRTLLPSTGIHNTIADHG